MLEEGKTGYYFDDEEELLRKWETYFSLSDQEKQEMQVQCVEKTKPYSTSMFASKALAVYEQAIDSYHRAFTVEKVKMVDDFVKLTLKRDSDEEPVTLRLPIDDYFDLKIALRTELDAYIVEDYLAMQNYYKAYSILKKKVFQKDHTAYQIKKTAMRKLDLSQEEAESIVEEFEKRHWIDDRQYALDKVQVWSTYGYGKKKIASKLKEAGVAQSYIEEACAQVEQEDELNAAMKSAQRIMATIREQSDRLKRQTIIQKLISKGYSVDVAKQAGDSIKLDGDEKEALYLSLKKAKRMYASLEEPKRTNKIRIYCLRKGFSVMQIDEVLESESK